MGAKLPPLCVTACEPDLRKCRMPCGSAGRDRMVALQDVAGSVHAHVMYDMHDR